MNDIYRCGLTRKEYDLFNRIPSNGVDRYFLYFLKRRPKNNLEYRDLYKKALTIYQNISNSKGFNEFSKTGKREIIAKKLDELK